ncbi:hypothetical protein RFI_24009 [Reticulomyxa filosa]|uniref:Uncharacterized protein n=1 Tax=Reticulomyxa filosa TaxID=46433 RepID=X6MIZ0_RETFI|nr:hypothetical protein RFI_24009 [Reticulomyxa filosa]|eukprot:ETO13367.1 hypothetical protein RFI_24009 [Reticulomyxa filosa]
MQYDKKKKQMTESQKLKNVRSVLQRIETLFKNKIMLEDYKGRRKQKKKNMNESYERKNDNNIRYSECEFILKSNACSSFYNKSLGNVDIRFTKTIYENEAQILYVCIAQQYSSSKHIILLPCPSICILCPNIRLVIELFHSTLQRHLKEDIMYNCKHCFVFIFNLSKNTYYFCLFSKQFVFLSLKLQKLKYANATSSGAESCVEALPGDKKPI